MTNLLVVVVVVMAAKAVSSGSPVLMGGVIALPILIYFVNRPTHLLIASFLVSAAGFTLPGIPGGFSLAGALQAFVVVVGIAYLAVDKDRNRRRERSELLLAGLILVIFLTMAVRGTGIRILGGDLWGGRTYIAMILVTLFYIFSPWIRLDSHHVKFLVIGRLVAGLLPAFVQAAFLLSGGTFYILAYFIDAQLQGVARAAFGVEDSISRLSTLRSLGASLLPLAFVFPLRGWKAIVIPLVIIPLSLFLTALSGFRTFLFGMLAICVLWGFVTIRREKRLMFVSCLVAAGLACWLALVAGAGRLFPLNVQRAMSWIPLAEISEVAKENAAGSTSWRVDIWRMALDEIPKYAVIGKGVSFPASYLTLMSTQEFAANDPRFAFRMHNYHSGPLQLLLDLGVPGFLLCTAFFLASCSEHASALKRFTKPTIEHRYYRFLTVVYVWQVASFFLLYGDLNQVFVRILVSGALLRILRYSLEDQLVEEEEEGRQDHDGNTAEPAPREPPQVRAATWIGA